MGTILPAIKPTDGTAADAQIGLQRLNDADVIDSDRIGATWLLHILGQRTSGALALKPAVFLTLYVLKNQPPRTVGEQWAHLAAAEILGQVDASTLTRECLAHLVQDAQNLHLQVFNAVVRTPTALTNLANARKNAARSVCGGTATPFLSWYDRVADALSSHLRG